MRILITNNTLAQRAGSELYVRDLASGLAKRGHQPIAYSANLGDVADEMRAAGLTVINDLSQLATPPDIIHGHHHLDTMAALLHFHQTPAIFVCHSAVAWEEEAPHFPRILRYVAVDLACRDRLIREHGIAEDKIRLILNFVDLDRFTPRPALPLRPQRALVLSNQASKYTHVGMVREACRRAGVSLDVVGHNAGRVSAAPEALLGDHDIVFAKGRSALEALAVGNAVILCDAIGVGEMVTRENVEQLRPLNFGFRTLDKPLSVAALSEQITRYDPANALQVSEFIRANCGLEATIDELLQLYREVINDYQFKGSEDNETEWRATSAYLSGLQLHLHEIAALKENEAELNRIKNSRGWRLVTRYARAKNKMVALATIALPALSRTGGNGSAPSTQSSRETFRQIYRSRAWGNGESLSGPGSSVARVAAFKADLESLLRELQVHSLLDAGCGDFNWMKDLNAELAQYIGVDIVPEIVSANQSTHKSETRIFLNLDITSDSLPQVDLIICRDCLVHLPFKSIVAALKNFHQSNSTYLLATSFPGLAKNADIQTGGWRQLNLMLPPFNFPEPRNVIDEKRTLSPGDQTVKYLGLWELGDLF